MYTETKRGTESWLPKLNAKGVERMKESLPCGSSRKAVWQRWPRRAQVPMRLPLHGPPELNFLPTNWFHHHPSYTIGSLKAKEVLYSPLGFHCLKKNRYRANVDWINLINKRVLGESHTLKGCREGIQWSLKSSPTPRVWSNRAGGSANSPSEAHDREWPRASDSTRQSQAREHMHPRSGCSS